MSCVAPRPSPLCTQAPAWGPARHGVDEAACQPPFDWPRDLTPHVNQLHPTCCAQSSPNASRSVLHTCDGAILHLKDALPVLAGRRVVLFGDSLMMGIGIVG
eukprot:5764840-Prymnesium_polylepis.1